MTLEMVIGIFGKLAGSVATSVAYAAFGKTGDELTARVSKAIDVAAEKFFERYQGRFGKPHESFLARQENWEVVALSLRIDAPDLDPTGLDPSGYDGAPDADEEALRFYVEVVREAFMADLFLSILLGQKDSISIARGTEEKLLSAIEELSTDICDQASRSGTELRVSVEEGDLSPQTHLEEGRLYVREIAPNVKLIYMRRGDRVYSEASLDDGAVMYYEIDENAHISIRQPPYPVKLNILPEYVLGHEYFDAEDGDRRLVIHGKYGMRIEGLMKSSGEFVNPVFKNAQLEVNSKDKLMTVKPKGV